MSGRTDLPAPPSRDQWRIDGEIRGGHSVADAVTYLEWCDDWAAQQAADRAVPAFIISPEIPSWRGLFRRRGGGRA